MSTVFLRQVGIEEGGNVVSPNVTVRAPNRVVGIGVKQRSPTTFKNLCHRVSLN